MLPVAALASLLACGAPDEAPRAAPPVAAASAPFAEPGACAACHPREAGLWTGSDHDRAMQPATQETVLGDFDGASFAHFPVMTRFFRRDGRYFVNTEGPDGENADFEVLYTFGVEPLQQYLVALSGGRLQALPVAWDTQRGRWFDLQPDEREEPGSPFHWTGRYQRWNAMCAECHSTGLVKGYDADSDTYRTTWAGIDVGCQACHGPGAAHVAWAREHADAPSGEAEGLSPRFGMDEADGEIEVCAPCHSRRHPISDDPVYGRPFLDHFVPRTLLPGLYHPDGQILGEVYVYGSFLQSRMHERGVRCSDCHDPHSLALADEGNALCTRCHSERGNPRFPTLTKKRYDAREHHFHPDDSPGARCVECHMSAATFMQIDRRRDHGLRIPRPDLSAALGTPDVCTGCHDDRDAAWAAARVQKWYGAERPASFAPAFAAADAGNPEAGADLVAIASDASRPAIVRATALDLLRNYPPVGLQAAIEALADADPLVRVMAVANFERAPAALRARFAASRLDDPVRAVRVEAARVMASVPAEQLTSAQTAHLETALAEYAEAQHAQDDLPAAYLNLGVVETARGDTEAAERSYRRALEMDPDFLPARANLVHVFNDTGRPEEAERVLREGLRRSPGEGELHYSLGLLLAEQGRLRESAQALSQAAAHMPDRSRVHYNLGLALQRLGRDDEAAAALRRAARLDPRDASVPVALGALLLRRGDAEGARAQAEAALRIAPDLRAARQLLSQAEAATPAGR